MGSADPVISWLFKAGGRIDAWNATGLGARLERAILTSDLSGPRGTTWDLPKSSGGKSEVDSIATTAAKEGHLTEAEGKAIDSLLSNWRLSEKMRPFGLDGAIEVAEQLVEFRKLQGSFSTLFPEAETGLAKLRALHPAKSALLFDGPTLMEWTKFPEGGPKGIDPDVAGNTFVSQRTHLDYNRVKYRYRLEGDPHHAERLAQVIEAGQPVLLRRGDPEDMPYNYSHCLSALDVRGEPGRREFLVADSMPGSARWISEEEFDFSYFFGHSYPTLGVGRRAAGRPEL